MDDGYYWLLKPGDSDSIVEVHENSVFSIGSAHVVSTRRMEQLGFKFIPVEPYNPRSQQNG